LPDYRTRDVARDGARYGSWTLILGVITLVVILLLSAMFLFGFGLFQRGTADFRGKTKQIEQTRGSGTYRIAAYEHFYDLCAAVQDDEASIDSLKQELKGDPKPSGSRVGQINGALTALRSSRVEKMNQYNADARKEGTQGQFRDSGLPYRLDKTNKETTCIA
jgi:hypothetical protein